jgi:hypothetical protein
MMAAILALVATIGSAAPPPGTPAEVTLRSASPDRLRIVVVGDTGTGAGKVAAGIAKIHRAAPVDAIILTGDNFYPCGVTSETDPRWRLALPLTKIGPPVLPVLGNHDVDCGKADPMAQIRATGRIPGWQFPARQYVVRSGLATFAMLDTTPFVRARNQDAETFLRTALTGATTPWRIVAGHHPIISSGFHGYFPRDEVRLMRPMADVMKSVGAELYLCGHDHHLELIRGKVLYLVSGAGSDPIPPIRLRQRTIFPSEIGRERLGFAVVELTREKVRVRFHDGDGRPRAGWIELGHRR